ncbi:MAG: hypothetical protein CMH57_09680 [Myxococcales bacterium]|nr:hypothetical protein [Myxococcales bacterium]
MSNAQGGRGRALAWCAAAYGLALVAGVGAGWLARDLPSWQIALVADLAATTVVFGFSAALRNSSMYDPYWSVAPIPIVLYFAWTPQVEGVSPVRVGLVLTLVLLWGGRLTYNCVRRWGGLDHEDWRYQDLRRQTGALFPVVDFLGIHQMPTLLVFMGCMAAYAAVSAGAAPLGALDALGFGVGLGGIAMELVADEQLHDWLTHRHSPGAIMDEGLWRYSRHPNYVGEVLFWWGLALLGWGALPGAWWVPLGAAAITVLFVTISVPLMEKRSLERRPGYAEHQAKVSAFIPWFRRER